MSGEKNPETKRKSWREYPQKTFGKDSRKNLKDIKETINQIEEDKNRADEANTSESDKNLRRCPRDQLEINSSQGEEKSPK